MGYLDMFLLFDFGLFPHTLLLLISMQVAGFATNALSSPTFALPISAASSFPPCFKDFRFPALSDLRTSAASFSDSGDVGDHGDFGDLVFGFLRVPSCPLWFKLLVDATSSCSAPAPPADTPANYVSSTQSHRIHPPDAGVTKSFCFHIQIPASAAAIFRAQFRAWLRSPGRPTAPA